MATTLLGPAFIAVGDGTSTFGRLAVEDGRIANVLPADGPADHALPPGSSIAPGGKLEIDRSTGRVDGPCIGRSTCLSPECKSHPPSRSHWWALTPGDNACSIGAHSPGPIARW